MNPKILSLGDTNVDLIAFVGKYPVRGGNAFGYSLKKFIGGTAVNLAIGVSRLGETVGCISNVGSDEFGKSLLDSLKEEDIDISHLHVEDGTSTGTVFIVVDEDGERTFFAFRNGCADTRLRPEDIDEEYIRSARLLQVSGVSFIDTPVREAALTAMRLAKKNKVTVSLDPNLRLEKWKMPTELVKPFHEALSLSEIIMLGKEELLCLTNTAKQEDGIEKLLQLGPKIIALKLGRKGCQVITKESVKSHPAFPVKVVDTTGAGDAFNAGFLVGYVNAFSLEKTALLANAVGAMRVTRQVGTGLPSRSEVNSFLKKHLEEKWTIF